MGEILTIIIRLILPLSILRFPLFGALLSISLDYFDYDFIRFLNNGDLTNYQIIDKALDLYYLSLELYVTTSWQNSLVKITSLLLFIYRILGILLFFLTQNVIFLVIFLNLFEFFYLFYLGFRKIFQKDPVTSIVRLMIIFFLLLIPKFLHEYSLHITSIDKDFIMKLLPFFDAILNKIF